MDTLARRFHIGAETVTTIECSPRRASAGQLELLKGLGFTRLSFGIQDLDARVQHAIGRVNSLGLVRDVCETARTIGFENISLDLIYGLPKQTVESFESTLERVVEIAPDRVRCFSYSHRPTARPHQYAIETVGLPGPEEKLTLLHSAVRSFTEAGFHWIGVDCFARNGDDLVDAKAAGTLRHTCLGYTSAATRHLVALGSSSLGEVDRVFIQNQSTVEAWSKDLEAGRFPIQWGYCMSDAERRHRDAMHLLMCNLEVPANLATDLEPEINRLTQWARAWAGRGRQRLYQGHPARALLPAQPLHPARGGHDLEQQSMGRPATELTMGAHEILQRGAGAAPARIGPNAIWRVLEALQAGADPTAVERVFERAGLAGYLQALPQEMVDEREVTALHQALRDELGIKQARQIGADAGSRTGDYLLAKRIPRPAQTVLRLLPGIFACRILLKAIERNAWTFAGSAGFSTQPGKPTRFILDGLPRLPRRHGTCAPLRLLRRYLRTAFPRVDRLQGPGHRGQVPGDGRPELHI